MGVLIFSLIIYLNLPKPILSIILHLNCSNPNETPGSERIMHSRGHGFYGDCHYTINLTKKKKTVKEDLEFGYFFKCCYQHEHSARLHWMYCSSHFHVTLASHVKRFTDTNFCSDVSPFICLFIPRVISMQPKWVSKSQKRKNESSFKNCLQSCMWQMLIFGIVMLICWVCVCVCLLYGKGTVTLWLKYHSAVADCVFAWNSLFPSCTCPDCRTASLNSVRMF